MEYCNKQNNLINDFNIQMAGGDATSGASIAASGTKNNRLSETQYEAYKKELAEAGNNPAKIKEVLTVFTYIDKANEDLLESKLEDQDFNDGLAKALQANPNLKEYQGVIINGKSIQNAYSGEKELAVGYGGVDENGNDFLRDKKVAIDAKNKDLQSDILLTGISLATSGAPKIVKGMISLYNYGSAIYDGYNAYIEKDNDALKRSAINFSGQAMSDVISNSNSAYRDKAPYINIVNAILKQSLTNYNDVIKRPTTNTKGGK